MFIFHEFLMYILVTKGSKDEKTCVEEHMIIIMINQMSFFIYLHKIHKTRREYFITCLPGNPVDITHGINFLYIQYPQCYFHKINNRIGLMYEMIEYTHERTRFTHDMI